MTSIFKYNVKKNILIINIIGLIKNIHNLKLYGETDPQLVNNCKYSCTKKKSV